jgi:hypothetical protein
LISIATDHNIKIFTGNVDMKPAIEIPDREAVKKRKL